MKAPQEGIEVVFVELVLRFCMSLIFFRGVYLLFVKKVKIKKIRKRLKWPQTNKTHTMKQRREDDKIRVGEHLPSHLLLSLMATNTTTSMNFLHLIPPLTNTNSFLHVKPVSFLPITSNKRFNGDFSLSVAFNPSGSFDFNLTEDESG